VRVFVFFFVFCVCAGVCGVVFCVRVWLHCVVDAGVCDDGTPTPLILQDRTAVRVSVCARECESVCASACDERFELVSSAGSYSLVC
jgi:hypothetical protein